MKQFGNSWVYGLIPAIFAVGSAYYLASNIYHLIAAVPMEVPNGKYEVGTHIASPGEMLGGSVFWLLFFVLSCFGILEAFNAGIEADDKLIRNRNLFGKVVFQAAWSELTSVSATRTDYRGISYTIRSKHGHLTFIRYSNASEKLEALVRASAPHLDFRPWDALTPKES